MSWRVKNELELPPEESFRKFILSGLKMKTAEIKEIIRINEQYDNQSRFKVNCKFTLGELKCRGYKLAVVSNSWIRSSLLQLNKANMTEYLDAVIISCDVGKIKPDRQIFQIAAKELDVSLFECAFVGDSHFSDIFGVYQSGITLTIGIMPFKFKIELEPPTALIKSLEEVIQILAQED